MDSSRARAPSSCATGSGGVPSSARRSGATLSLRRIETTSWPVCSSKRRCRAACSLACWAKRVRRRSVLERREIRELTFGIATPWCAASPYHKTLRAPSRNQARETRGSMRSSARVSMDRSCPSGPSGSSARSKKWGGEDCMHELRCELCQDGVAGEFSERARKVRVSK